MTGSFPADAQTTSPPTEDATTDASSAADFSYAQSSAAQKSRLSSLQERTLPALIMVALVGAIAKYGKEDGLIALTFVLQVGMYQEMTQVIGGSLSYNVYKWWWFLTAAVAWNFPRMFPYVAGELALASYAMTVVGICSSIIYFNAVQAQPDQFRDFLRPAAVSMLSAVRTSTMKRALMEFSW